MSSVYGEKDARGKRKGRGSIEYRSIRELARGHPFGQSESTRVMLRNQDVNFIIVNEDASMGWDVRARTMTPFYEAIQTQAAIVTHDSRISE